MVTQERANQIAHEAFESVFGHPAAYLSVSLGTNPTEEGLRAQMLRSLTDFRDGNLEGCTIDGLDEEDDF